MHDLLEWSNEVMNQHQFLQKKIYRDQPISLARIVGEKIMINLNEIIHFV